MSPVAMILGNAEYALGNWGSAAEAYLRVWERAGSPLAALNAARSFHRQGSADRALGLFLAAAQTYHRRGNLAELELLVAELEGTHAGRAEVRSLRARLLYWQGDEEAAGRELSLLVAEGVADSAVIYLDGLILARRGLRSLALERFRRAVEIEPEAAVYWFRLAETLHLEGQDPEAALDRALRLSPDDPWSTNLKGLVLASKGRLQEAQEVLTRASELAPDAPEIAVNLSDVLHRQGRSAEALEFLEGALGRSPEAHALMNQRGNILAGSGDVVGAQAEYERALRGAPANADYLENCARVCIETDHVLRAEECLRRLLEVRPSAEAYNLMGNVAALQRQYDRAEAAYREGLHLAPDDPSLLANLAALLVQQGSQAGARAAIRALEAFAAGSPEAQARAGRIRELFRARFEEALRCSCCGRLWWVPRELGYEAPLRVRGDPPDEAPVGSCPDCGRILCAACARANVVDGRFTCNVCGVPLRLSDPRIVHLLRRSLEGAAERGSGL
jgi:tetratricopeptide (TPR) repeat protein